jgi:hypothetical protein
MWLSDEEERLLEEIRETKQLTKDELESVRTYGGFKNAKALDPNSKGVGTLLYNQLQDILKKYGGNPS